MAFRSFTQSGGDTCNMPAGAAADDILILFSSRDSGGNSATFPSGFTAFTANNLSGPDGQSYAAAWKRHSGSEPSTLQVTFSGGGASQTTGCMAFSGRSTSAPPVATLTTNTSSNSSPISAALTGVTASANDDICALITFDSDAGVEHSSMTAPGSYTLDVNQWDNANFWSIIGSAHRDNVSAGATGSLTFGLTLPSGGAGFAGYVIRIPVAGGSDTALAGDAAAVATASAALTTGIAAAGDAACVATASAALTTGIQLAGASTSVATAAADLTTGNPNIAGDAAVVSTATADLTTAIRLAADAAALVTASADLLTGIALAGAAQSLADATGNLLTAIQLAAAPSGVTTSNGVLVNWVYVTVSSPDTGPGSIFDSRWWTGDAPADGDLIAYEDRGDGFVIDPTGQYSAPVFGSWLYQFAYASTPTGWTVGTADLVQSDFVADAYSVASVTGDLLTAIQLAADAAAVATATASLTAGAAELAGAAQAVATAAADLTTAIQLAGDGLCQATVVGVLDATIISLDGAAAAVATAQADLTTGIPLAGDAVVVATAAGLIDTAINLAATAQVVVTATGDISGFVVLAGAAEAVATASADLTAAIQLEAAAVAEASAFADLMTEIILAGIASAEASATATLSTEEVIVGYCNRDDLVQRFGAREIDDLLDRDNNGDDDTDTLQETIEDADALIDGYLGSRYAVPLETVPHLIRSISCDITRYKLWDDNAPDEVRKRYEDAVKQLRDIANGLISLPIDTPPSETGGAGGIEYEANERIFTMTTLADF
jgi:phage gp36-like protein